VSQARDECVWAPQPSFMTYSRGLLDRRSRSSTLEVAIVAHILIGTVTLRSIHNCPLSAAALLLCELIEENPATSRSGILASPRVGLRVLHAAGLRDESLCSAVMRLAAATVRTTVGELASVGPTEHVVRLLASAGRDDQPSPAQVEIAR
jgi:hypothetical protein